MRRRRKHLRRLQRQRENVFSLHAIPLQEMKMGIGNLGEWRYIVAAFVITILMTAILVLLLPDKPYEFW